MRASPDYELRPWQRTAIDEDGTAPCLTCAGTGTISVDRNLTGPCPDFTGMRTGRRRDRLVRRARMALSVAGCAGALAAALARCPEAVCRRYLPHGRRQGRYWVAGDLHGARGRSLYVRLRPPGPPGKWTDAVTGEHGDLLDLIGHRIGASTLGPALVAAVSGPDGTLEGVQRTWLHPARPAKAPVAQPRKALGRVHGHAVRFGAPGGTSTTLLVGEGIETVLSLVAAAPALPGAAALSAGSLAAFVPPPGTARLLIATDAHAAGRRAAAGLEARAMVQGLAAVVLVPAHGDFNDDLAALGRWPRGSPRSSATGPHRERRRRAQRDAASAIIGPCASSTPKDRCDRTTTTPSRRWTGWTWRNCWI